MGQRVLQFISGGQCLLRVRVPGNFPTSGKVGPHSNALPYVVRSVVIVSLVFLHYSSSKRIG